MPQAKVAVVGVGINATDTIINLPRFPEFNSKLEFTSSAVFPGGQIASALVACRRWGLSARYVGSVGDDAAAALQALELKKRRIEAHLIRVRRCASQLSYILVDGRSGERTILWKRDHRLTLKPRQLRHSWIRKANVLLVDGHDTAAAAWAANCARKAKIPVVTDVDNVYPGIEALLEHTDYLFTSAEFPARFLRTRDLLSALQILSTRFRCKVSGATLGRLGAVAWDGVQFHYCRGYRVDAKDTTGAGDIFHAGIVYGITQRWNLKETLEFSCAAAALNCTAAGARSGIKSLREIRGFMRTARRSEPAFSLEQLVLQKRTQSKHS